MLHTRLERPVYLFIYLFKNFRVHNTKLYIIRCQTERIWP